MLFTWKAIWQDELGVDASEDVNFSGILVLYIIRIKKPSTYSSPFPLKLVLVASVQLGGLGFWHSIRAQRHFLTSSKGSEKAMRFPWRILINLFSG